MAIACHSSCGVAEGKMKKMVATVVARIVTKKAYGCHSLYINQTPTNNLVYVPATSVAWEMVAEPN